MVTNFILGFCNNQRWQPFTIIWQPFTIIAQGSESDEFYKSSHKWLTFVQNDDFQTPPPPVFVLSWLCGPRIRDVYLSPAQCASRAVMTDQWPTFNCEEKFSIPNNWQERKTWLIGNVMPQKTERQALMKQNTCNREFFCFAAQTVSCDGTKMWLTYSGHTMVSSASGVHLTCVAMMLWNISWAPHDTCPSGRWVTRPRMMMMFSLIGLVSGYSGSSPDHRLIGVNINILISTLTRLTNHQTCTNVLVA